MSDKKLSSRTTWAQWEKPSPSPRRASLPCSLVEKAPSPPVCATWRSVVYPSFSVPLPSSGLNRIKELWRTPKRPHAEVTPIFPGECLPEGICNFGAGLRGDFKPPKGMLPLIPGAVTMVAAPPQYRD